MNLNDKTFFLQWIKGEEYYNRIYNFLICVDEILIPKLSERVDISIYTMKLATYAHNMFAVSGGEDVAACSVYCDKKDAYISSIAVKKEYQRNGIGSMILREVVKHVRERGCLTIKLEVNSDNNSALLFYKNNGFEIETKKDDWYIMTINID